MKTKNKPPSAVGKRRTRKPHAPKSRRRVRHPNRKVSLAGGNLENVMETMTGMALLDMTRGTGIRPIQVLLMVRALARNKPPSPSSNKEVVLCPPTTTTAQ